MAYTFQKALGGSIGGSICEDDKLTLALDMMKKAESRGVKFLLPLDNVAGDAFSNDCNRQTVKAGLFRHVNGVLGAVRPLGEAVEYH